MDERKGRSMTLTTRRRRTATRLAAAAAVVVLASACGSGQETGAGSGPPEGEAAGEATVRLARADWDTGFFQAEVYRQLLQELGHPVTDPAQATLAPESFYPALADGELDLWANGWFPLHRRYLDRELVTGQTIDQPIEPVGTQVPQGAVQGYVVDRATAKELDVTSMADFTRSEVVEAFDQDGNGRADLYGCQQGWGCNRRIAAHLAEHPWGASVEQVVGDYEGLVEQARQRIDAGKPTLLYTWTPNWTVEVLEPGNDVLWLEAPSRPDAPAPTAVEGLQGCAGGDPCQLGWTVNDIRAVANRDFLDANPAVRRLLEVVTIPLADIAAQNADMAGAEDYGQEAIQQDAAEWIRAHRQRVDRWLTHARQG
jgi:glycine betaine/proline transport system substrate-binding protein